jgi:hypothetical protein
VSTSTISYLSIQKQQILRKEPDGEENKNCHKSKCGSYIMIPLIFHCR